MYGRIINIFLEGKKAIGVVTKAIAIGMRQRDEAKI